MVTYQELSVRVRVDMGVMAMKVYFKLPRLPQIELKHPMHFSIIPRTPIFWGLIRLPGE